MFMLCVKIIYHYMHCKQEAICCYLHLSSVCTTIYAYQKEKVPKRRFLQQWFIKKILQWTVLKIILFKSFTFLWYTEPVMRWKVSLWNHRCQTFIFNIIRYDTTLSVYTEINFTSIRPASSKCAEHKFTYNIHLYIN